MLVITIQIKRPPGQAIGIKEQIAMDLEKYGDVQVVSIEERDRPMEQMRMGGTPNHWDR